MTPIEFPEQNITIKGDGARSFDLPAHYNKKHKIITSCHKLTLDEVGELVENGVIYLQILTFGDPMQPVRLSIQNPLKQEDPK